MEILAIQNGNQEIVKVKLRSHEGVVPSSWHNIYLNPGSYEGDLLALNVPIMEKLPA
jgi:hypothetical protein